MTINQENYYWLFSSSAQTISAFVAFLVTGYAIVLNVMDGLEQKDDTLSELHLKIKASYYKNIIVLVIITALAIILSLWMVYLNGVEWDCKHWLFPITVIVDFAAVVLGVLFVLSIINPKKYRKAAAEIIKEEKKDFPDTGQQVDPEAFAIEFIKLEKDIRDLLKSKNLFVPYGDTPQMMYSVRQMAEALYRNQLINRNQLLELLKINKYRNLVFHGHLEKVDKSMLDRLNQASKMIGRIK